MRGTCIGLGHPGRQRLQFQSGSFRDVFADKATVIAQRAAPDLAVRTRPIQSATGGSEPTLTPRMRFGSGVELGIVSQRLQAPWPHAGC